MREVRDLLRGVYRELGLATGGARSEPLYLELVHALADVVMRPTLAQRRAEAALLLTYMLRLPTMRLARLKWSDLRFVHGRLEVQLRSRIGRGPYKSEVLSISDRTDTGRRTIEAVRALRSQTPAGQMLVFGDSGVDWTYARLLAAVSHLRTPASDSGRSLRPKDLERALTGAGQPDPAQLRDRALIVLGFLAGLRTREAATLAASDIRISQRGLTLHIRGRRGPTFIAGGHEPRYDPVACWVEWCTHAAARWRSPSSAPAFPLIKFTVIQNHRMSEAGLNLVIHQRCAQAGLVGNYAFTSLRTGMMRTAARADTPSHVIAAQADLRSLGSVQRHEQRENLLRHSVAAQLGL